MSAPARCTDIAPLKKQGFFFTYNGAGEDHPASNAAPTASRNSSAMHLQKNHQDRRDKSTKFSKICANSRLRFIKGRTLRIKEI
jgi:hypothetical protein